MHRSFINLLTLITLATACGPQEEECTLKTAFYQDTSVAKGGQLGTAKLSLFAEKGCSFPIEELSLNVRQVQLYEGDQPTTRPLEDIELTLDTGRLLEETNRGAAGELSGSDGTTVKFFQEERRWILHEPGVVQSQVQHLFFKVRQRPNEESAFGGNFHVSVGGIWGDVRVGEHPHEDIGGGGFDAYVYKE